MNRKFYSITIFVLSICIFSNVLAQDGNIPLGTWRIHTSLYQANSVEIVGDKVYCGTSGGLFYFDKDDGQLQRLTVKDGFSDVNVTALRYVSNKDLLIIGYENGNIDILKGQVIYNISDIKRSNRVGSKKINHITPLGNNQALLASDIGGIVINLDRLEIKESYLNIGANGTGLSAYRADTKGDSVYLATSQGILASKYTSGNLMDYKSWKKIVIADSLTTKTTSTVCIHKDNIYIGYDNVGVFTNANGQWRLAMPHKGQIFSLLSSSIGVFAGLVSEIKKIDSNGDVASIPGSPFLSVAKDIVEDKDGILWLADDRNGLLKYIGGNFSSYIPNSPYSNYAFNFYNYEDKMMVLSGGYDGVVNSLNRNKGYYELEKGEWKNYVPGRELPFYLTDVSDAIFDKSRNSLFVGTQAYGVLVQNKFNGQISFINNETEGCPLSISFPNYINIRAVALYNDELRGEVWICNVVADDFKIPTIHKFKKNNTCDSYIFPYLAAKFPIQLLIDEGNNKWVRLANDKGGGILVFNDKQVTNQVPKYISLTEGKGIGNLSSNNVRCMVKDKKGDIWLGTTKGVCVFYNPIGIVDKLIDASTPIYQNRPLLFDQVATCMDVDGGNRKWIGTTNGLYLMNADGTQVIHYFNTDNSPILSNNISSVKINQQNGEVFIATEVGLVSYREASTLGKDEAPSAIEIFPNPMKTDFVGQVGFANLANNAVVKITDITGRLVYETQANGGTASWNGKDYNGKKVSSGVYLILTAKDDGEAAIAGKLFVVD